MDVRIVATPGLGDSTYVLGFDGIGLVVDPQRDIDRFEGVVDDLGVEVRWILETHLHNDYVSGARDLAASLGAELVVPAGAAPVYRHRPAFHLEELTGGPITIRPLHTPGHTPEHVSYVVVIDGVDRAVFTGGSLLVGSAGRSDLLGAERADSLARLQYRSVNRLAELPDSTVLYPTHGAGSFCTASQTSLGVSDIGTEKRTNPVLAHTDVDKFVSAHLSGLAAYPSYYQHMGAANVAGAPALSLETPPILSESDFSRLPAGTTVIDARPKSDFGAGHLPGSIGVELRDDFGVWVGWVAEFDTDLVLVLNPDQDEEEAIRQLGRIGFDHLVGLIKDLPAWSVDLTSHQVVGLDSFIQQLDGNAQLLDVRAPSEWETGVIEGSILGYAPDVASSVPEDLDRSRPVLIACGTGHRASVVASFLSQEGFDPVVLVGAGVPEVLSALDK